jgi:hypothetical protein
MSTARHSSISTNPHFACWPSPTVTDQHSVSPMIPGCHCSCLAFDKLDTQNMPHRSHRAGMRCVRLSWYYDRDLLTLLSGCFIVHILFKHNPFYAPTMHQQPPFFVLKNVLSFYSKMQLQGLTPHVRQQLTVFCLKARPSPSFYLRTPLFLLFDNGAIVPFVYSMMPPRGPCHSRWQRTPIFLSKHDSLLVTWCCSC